MHLQRNEAKEGFSKEREWLGGLENGEDFTLEGLRMRIHERNSLNILFKGTFIKLE